MLWQGCGSRHQARLPLLPSLVRTRGDLHHEGLPNTGPAGAVLSGNQTMPRQRSPCPPVRRWQGSNGRGRSGPPIQHRAMWAHTVIRPRLRGSGEAHYQRGGPESTCAQSRMPAPRAAAQASQGATFHVALRGPLVYHRFARFPTPFFPSLTHWQAREHTEGLPSPMRRPRGHISATCSLLAPSIQAPSKWAN